MAQLACSPLGSGACPTTPAPRGGPSSSGPQLTWEPEGQTGPCSSLPPPWPTARTGLSGGVVARLPGAVAPSALRLASDLTPGGTRAVCYPSPASLLVASRGSKPRFQYDVQFAPSLLTRVHQLCAKCCICNACFLGGCRDSVSSLLIPRGLQSALHTEPLAMACSVLRQTPKEGTGAVLESET